MSGNLVYLAFAVEWFALACAVGATLIVHPQDHGDARFAVIGILASGMGIQNAAFRKWGIPDLATNVMTLTMTGLITAALLILLHVETAETEVSVSSRSA